MSIPVINVEYLKKLNRPEEAISNDLWEGICNSIIKRSESNNNLDYIINQRINRIAPQFGILWPNAKDDPCITYLETDFHVIYNMKYMRDWFKGALVLTIFGLSELTDEQIDIMYDKVYKMSNREIKELENAPFYRTIRIEINKFLTKEKDNITNDTYEEIYKTFIKYVIKLLISNGNFNTDDIKKYINVAYQRLVNNKSYLEIATELDSQTGMISNIVHKFVDEFKKAYQTDEELAYLCRKFENFYDKAFEELDDSDYKERNKRLGPIKLFQKTFITEELGTYIN
jgi:hypothetical protein